MKMGLLAETKKIFHHVAVALHLAKRVAQFTIHADAKIQSCNCPSELKTLSAALAASAAAFLAALAAYKATL